MSIELIWIMHTKNKEKYQYKTHFGCPSRRGYIIHCGTCKYDMDSFDRSTLLSDPER
jgi:hypothetical protein